MWIPTIEQPSKFGLNVKCEPWQVAHHMQYMSAHTQALHQIQFLTSCQMKITTVYVCVLFVCLYCCLYARVPRRTPYRCACVVCMSKKKSIESQVWSIYNTHTHTQCNTNARCQSSHKTIFVSLHTNVRACDCVITWTELKKKNLLPFILNVCARVLNNFVCMCCCPLVLMQKWISKRLDHFFFLH